MPWERAELGACSVRLVRTLADLWTRPERTMLNLFQRRSHPIENAARLIAACLVLSLSICLLGYLLQNAIVVARQRATTRAMLLMFSSVRATGSADLALASAQALSPLIWGSIAGIVLRRRLRSRLGALRSLDFLAVLGPLMPLGALWVALTGVLDAALGFRIANAFLVGPILSELLLAAFAWYFGRRVLRFGVAGSFGVVLSLLLSQAATQMGIIYGFYLADDSGASLTTLLSAALALFTLVVAALMLLNRYRPPRDS